MQTIAKQVADDLGNKLVELLDFGIACHASEGVVIQSHQGPGPVMGGVYQTYKFPDGSAISLHPFGLEVFEGTAEAPRVLSNGKFLRPGWTGRSGKEGLHHVG